MKDSSLLIGRDKEVKILEESYNSKKPEFIAILGRRRIGKTSLVKKTFERKIGFELIGLSEGNKKEQLQNFLFTLRRFYPNSSVTELPKNWMEAFSVLSNEIEILPNKGKQILFFDELPLIVTKRSDFITAFGWFWNSWASKRNILIIISGSATSWMIKRIINNKGGLHNRITRIIELKPFTLHETELFLNKKECNYKRSDILLIYMIMGGIPYYLEQLNPQLTFTENIDSLFFTNSGCLMKEYQHLIETLFDNSDRHLAVVKTLLRKSQGLKRRDIIRTTSLTNGGLLTETLLDLEQSGFISSFSVEGKAKRDKIYRLKDPYTLFAYSFLEEFDINEGVTFSQIKVSNKWRLWRSKAFVNTCLMHIAQIKRALGISGIYTKETAFSTEADNLKDVVQIDLVIDRIDKVINICEFKYIENDSEFISEIVVNEIVNKKKIMAGQLKSRKTVFATLITNTEFARTDHFINNVDQTVLIHDLFME